MVKCYVFDSSYLVPSLSSLVYDYEAGLVVGKYLNDVAFLINRDEPIELKGRIGTGEPINDDKPCSHRELDGDVFCFPATAYSLNCTYKNTIKVYDREYAAIVGRDPVDLTYFVRDQSGKRVEYRIHAEYEASTNSFLYWYARRTVGSTLWAGSYWGVCISANLVYISTSRSATFTTNDFESYVMPPVRRVPNYRVDSAWFCTPVFGDSAVYHSTASFVSQALKFTKDDIVPISLLRDTEASFGRCAVRALDNAKFLDTNLIAFITEYQSFSSQISTMLEGLSSLKKGSQAYLAYEYGLKNQVSDYNKIIMSFHEDLRAQSRMPQQNAYASENRYDSTGSRCITHYKVRYPRVATQSMRLLRTFEQYSLLPDWSMAWDLIPFSFMLDWFYNFGKQINYADFSNKYAVYEVISVTKSKKYVVPLRSVFFPIYVPDHLKNLSYRFYDRYVETSIDQPTFFDPSEPSPNPFRHIDEFGALLFSQ